MIIYNGTKLNSTSKDDFAVMQREQVQSLLKQKKRYYTFIFPDNKKSVDPDTGQEYWPKGGYVPFRTKYVPPFGATKNKAETAEWDVIYAKSSVYDKKNPGIEKFTPKYFDFGGDVTYDINTDKELIWWLLFACPYIEAIDGLAGQNSIREATKFKLQDFAKVAKEEVAYGKILAEVTRAIFDAEDGLSGDTLITIAKSYGVGTDGLDDDTLRWELNKKVLHQRLGKYDIERMKEFLNSVPKENTGLSEKTISTAVVTDLKALGMIQTTTIGNKGAWTAVGSGNVIMQFHPNENPNKALVDWFTKNPEIREGFVKAISEKREADPKDEK
jgi:hypothetical protein